MRRSYRSREERVAQRRAPTAPREQAVSLVLLLLAKHPTLDVTTPGARAEVSLVVWWCGHLLRNPPNSST